MKINGNQIKSTLFLKFIYSEKATKFWEISILLLTGPTTDKSKVEISQKVVFSKLVFEIPYLQLDLDRIISLNMIW